MKNTTPPDEEVAIGGVSIVKFLDSRQKHAGMTKLCFVGIGFNKKMASSIPDAISIIT